MLVNWLLFGESDGLRFVSRVLELFGPGLSEATPASSIARKSGLSRDVVLNFTSTRLGSTMMTQSQRFSAQEDGRSGLLLFPGHAIISLRTSFLLALNRLDHM